MQPPLCSPAEALAGSDEGNLLCGKETQECLPLYKAGQAVVLTGNELALHSFPAKLLSGPANVSLGP